MSSIPEKYFRRTFQIGIIIKGLDGILELVGGLLLFAIKPAALSGLAVFFTQHELAKDPKDFIANYLLHTAQNLPTSAKLFGAIYLASHGIIKILIVAGLLKNKLWAYPTAIAVFTAFGIYQIYRYTFSHAMSLVILTILDAVII